MRSENEDRLIRALNVLRLSGNTTFALGGHYDFGAEGILEVRWEYPLWKTRWIIPENPQAVISCGEKEIERLSAAIDKAEEDVASMNLSGLTFLSAQDSPRGLAMLFPGRAVIVVPYSIEYECDFGQYDEVLLSTVAVLSPKL